MISQNVALHQLGGHWSFVWSILGCTKGNTPIWSLLPTAQLLQFNLQWDFHRNIGRSILSSSGTRTEIRNKRRDHWESQSEIIPLIKIGIQRWIDPKVASWVLLSIHSGGRSPHHATIGYRSADFGWKNIWSDYLCIPSRRCINWARFAANFTHKVNEQYTLESTQSTYHSPHRKVIGKCLHWRLGWRWWWSGTLGSRQPIKWRKLVEAGRAFWSLMYIGIW